MCDLETSRIGAPYIYDISNLRVKEDNDPDGGDTTGIPTLEHRFSYDAANSRQKFSDYVRRKSLTIVYS